MFSRICFLRDKSKLRVRFIESLKLCVIGVLPILRVFPVEWEQEFP